MTKLNIFLSLQWYLLTRTVAAKLTICENDKIKYISKLTMVPTYPRRSPQLKTCEDDKIKYIFSFKSTYLPARSPS